MLHSQHLNVIASLSCDETNNIHCKYAGLSVYESVNNFHQEISLLCHSSERYKHRNIYSNTSYVLLVFYMYPEYSKFNIGLSLSGTSCNIVTLNACTLQYFCAHTDRKECIYLKRLPIMKTHCKIGEGHCTA